MLRTLWLRETARGITLEYLVDLTIYWEIRRLQRRHGGAYDSGCTSTSSAKLLQPHFEYGTKTDLAGDEVTGFTLSSSQSTLES